MYKDNTTPMIDLPFSAAGGPTPLDTKIIVSYHDFEGTPDDETLVKIVGSMWAAGADVAKIVTTAVHVADARRMLALLDDRSGMSAASGQLPCWSWRQGSAAGDLELVTLQ